MKQLVKFALLTALGFLIIGCSAGNPAFVTPEPATAVPTLAPATAMPPATSAPVSATSTSGSGTTSNCTFPAPGDLDAMPKVVIEQAQLNQWFHRVFNLRLFKAPNWDGADSWFVTLALGPNQGGDWTSFGNPGEIIYRATSTSVNWCLGIFTTSKWKQQFMGGTSMPAAVNIRIIPDTPITVRTVTGQIKTQNTSDGGDLTITLPNDGQIVIATAFTTAAPTFESRVWWGPQDRTENINILDASK